MSIAVVEKAFTVLEKLAEAQEPVPLARLAEASGLPKPTAYRILQTLAGLGYIGQGEAASYYLTPKLSALGQNGHASDLKLRVLPGMQRVYRQFNENVNLAVLSGANVQYLHTLETSRPLRLLVQPNAVDHYYTTAVGRAIVSHLPEKEQQALLRATHIKQMTSRSVGSKAELKKILAEARERGWAYEDEETVQGVSCLAVPVLDDGYPIAGISVTVPRTRLSPERRQEILASLQATDFLK